MNTRSLQHKSYYYNIEQRNLLTQQQFLLIRIIILYPKKEVLFRNKVKKPTRNCLNIQ